MNLSRRSLGEDGQRLGVSSFVSWLKSTMEGVTIERALARRADNFLILRIFAAALVIYGHAPHIAPAVENVDLFVRMGWGHYSGDIAVDTFFLISGFLVTGSYIRQKSLYKFAKARFLRVFPAFVLNVVALALVYGLLLTTLPKMDYLHLSGTWKYITTNLKMTSNMVWTLPGVFEEGLKTSTINGSQWTLPAEVRMYVLLGVMGALGLFASVRLATVVLGTLFIAALFHPEFFPIHPDWFRPGGFFLLGVLIYMHRTWITLRLEMAVAVVMLAVLTHHLAIYSVTFALALAGVVFSLAYLTPPLRWLERFGDPSYGIYLWGWPCQQLVAYFVPGAGLILHVTLALALATSFGYLSWALLEKRMMRLK